MEITIATWKLTQIFTRAEIESGNKKCEVNKCKNHSACSVWKSSEGTKILCSDHTERTFEGWPASSKDYPVEFLPEDNKAAIDEHCVVKNIANKYRSKPELPSTDRAALWKAQFQSKADARIPIPTGSTVNQVALAGGDSLVCG